MSNCTLEDFSSIRKSLGCTWGIERKLLLKYPIPSRDMINEDVLLGLIAMLHGGITYIPTATVNRTTGVGISSNRKFPSKLREKIVFLNRRVALLGAIVEVLRSTDRAPALFRAKRDLLAVMALHNYAVTGRSFFGALVCVARSLNRGYMRDLLILPIFRWLNAQGTGGE